jgi:hypothetical protein
MPRKRRQKAGLKEVFTVRSASRSTYQAYVYQHQIEVVDHVHDRCEFVAGARQYLLADGRNLRPIDDYTFEVEVTGERLTRCVAPTPPRAAQSTRPH